ILCTWPKGNREPFPFPYSDEVWTGVEYQVASHLIYRGFLKEGLTIVKALRERFDGLKRNPWDEPECGHHYARAMASWGLLLALSGYEYDGRNFTIGFKPRINTSDFKCFFSTNSGWGMFSQKVSQDLFRVDIVSSYGKIRMKSIKLEIPKRFGVNISVELIKDGEEKILKANLEENTIKLEETVELKEGEMVEILISP
ncbi:hypothetical protein H5T89_12190, partial [bacterium]|nr:hypothetical protein [bacterium]